MAEENGNISTDGDFRAVGDSFRLACEKLLKVKVRPSRRKLFPNVKLTKVILRPSVIERAFVPQNITSSTPMTCRKTNQFSPLSTGSVSPINDSTLKKNTGQISPRRKGAVIDAVNNQFIPQDLELATIEKTKSTQNEKTAAKASTSFSTDSNRRTRYIETVNNELTPQYFDAVIEKIKLKKKDTIMKTVQTSINSVDSNGSVDPVNNEFIQQDLGAVIKKIKTSQKKKTVLKAVQTSINYTSMRSNRRVRQTQTGASLLNAGGTGDVSNGSSSSTGEINGLLKSLDCESLTGDIFETFGKTRYESEDLRNVSGPWRVTSTSKTEHVVPTNHSSFQFNEVDDQLSDETLKSNRASVSTQQNSANSNIGTISNTLEQAKNVSPSSKESVASVEEQPLRRSTRERRPVKMRDDGGFLICANLQQLRFHENKYLQATVDHKYLQATVDPELILRKIQKVGSNTKSKNLRSGGISKRKTKKSEDKSIANSLRQTLKITKTYSNIQEINNDVNGNENIVWATPSFKEVRHLRGVSSSSTKGMNGGWLKIKAGKTKPKQKVVNNRLQFIVLDGQAEVGVEDNIKIFHKLDAFVVPIGKEYFVTNVDKKRDLILYYTKEKLQ